MPSPLEEGQTDKPIIRHDLGEVAFPPRPGPFFIATYPPRGFGLPMFLPHNLFQRLAP